MKPAAGDEHTPEPLMPLSPRVRPRSVMRDDVAERRIRAPHELGEHVERRVRAAVDLAASLAPDERSAHLAVAAELPAIRLGLQPLPQAIRVDEGERARARARADQGRRAVPAHATLALAGTRSLAARATLPPARRLGTRRLAAHATLPFARLRHAFTGLDDVES